MHRQDPKDFSLVQCWVPYFPFISLAKLSNIKTKRASFFVDSPLFCAMGWISSRIRKLNSKYRLFNFRTYLFYRIAKQIWREFCLTVRISLQVFWKFWKCNYRITFNKNSTKVKQASILRVEINYLIPYSSSKNSPLLKRTPFKTHYVHISFSQVESIKSNEFFLHLSFIYFRLCIPFFLD